MKDNHKLLAATLGLVAMIAVGLAWAFRFEPMGKQGLGMGYYRNRWTGTMYVQIGDTIETSAGREKRLERERRAEDARKAIEREQEMVRLENDRMQRENEEKEADEKNAEGTAAELVKQYESEAAKFLLEYREGSEIAVEREALKNMIYFANLLGNDEKEFDVRGKKLTRVAIVRQFVSWKAERKRLIAEEVRRLSAERDLAEHEVANSKENVLRAERVRYVGTLAKKGRYGNAEVKMIDMDVDNAEKKKRDAVDQVASVRQRELLARERLTAGY